MDHFKSADILFYHKYYKSYKVLNMMNPNKTLNKVRIF